MGNAMYQLGDALLELVGLKDQQDVTKAVITFDWTKLTCTVDLQVLYRDGKGEITADSQGNVETLSFTREIRAEFYTGEGTGIRIQREHGKDDV